MDILLTKNDAADQFCLPLSESVMIRVAFSKMITQSRRRSCTQAAVRRLLEGLHSIADAWNRQNSTGAQQRRVEFADLRDLYPRKVDGTGDQNGAGYRQEDLSKHPAIIYLPYQVRCFQLHLGTASSVDRTFYFCIFKLHCE
jgi:hypothetical protein